MPRGLGVAAFLEIHKLVRANFKVTDPAWRARDYISHTGSVIPKFTRR